MAKIPNQPEDIFTEITGDYQECFGDELAAILLYGSGARGDYVPRKSDLNFLVVLTDRGMDLLDKAVSTVARWRKRGVAVPLFMTREDMLRSVDAYPIEFLNMQRDHRLVFGENILEAFSFDRSLVRLQLERELRGKILHLRSGFLDSEGKEKPLRNLIRVSLTAFLSLFTALLYLKGLAAPSDRRDIVRAVGRVFPLNEAVYLTCLDIREDKDRLSGAGVRAAFREYLREIESLCARIDRIAP